MSNNENKEWYVINDVILKTVWTAMQDKRGMSLKKMILMFIYKKKRKKPTTAKTSSIS